MSGASPSDGPRWPPVLLATLTIGASVAAITGDREARPPTAITPLTVDLDRADAVELDLLPGIGPALAARIVADREANGPFGSPEGLGRVRGIGPAIVEGIRPHVRAASDADRDDG